MTITIKNLNDINDTQEGLLLKAAIAYLMICYPTKTIEDILDILTESVYNVGD